MLHDNAATYTQFHNGEGEVNYPYYRVEAGVSVKDADGETLLCSPN